MPADEHYISTLLAVHGLDDETDCDGFVTNADWVRPREQTFQTSNPIWCLWDRDSQSRSWVSFNHCPTWDSPTGPSNMHQLWPE